MKRLNILAIELNSSWKDKEANIKEVERRVLAAPSDIDLVILPEMFSTGFVTGELDEITELSETSFGDTMTRIHKLAEQRNMAIAGSFIARTNIKIYNRAFFIEPSGEEYFYDKYHLFGIGNESKGYSSGSSLPPIIRYRGWNIMPIVCFDLRFPAFCRNQDLKYDVLLVIANWPFARAFAWKQLLIARALENSCYVCGVNRSGKDEYGIDYGNQSSFAVDFKGNVVSHYFTEDMFVTALDPDVLISYRKKFPVHLYADHFDIL